MAKSKLRKYRVNSREDTKILKRFFVVCLQKLRKALINAFLYGRLDGKQLSRLYIRIFEYLNYLHCGQFMKFDTVSGVNGIIVMDYCHGLLTCKANSPQRMLNRVKMFTKN